MSTTATKRSYVHALADAEEFRALFFAGCYEQWEFAGSLRRKRPDVGDVEHVILPRFGDVPGDDIFAEPRRVNLLLHRLDHLVSHRQPGDNGRQLTRHVYRVDPATAKALHRWGEKYRGVDFQGFNHELFLADRDNWGPTLAIRTGPAEFSQKLVTRIKAHGCINDNGYVWRLEGNNRTRVSVPSERQYLELCGIGWIEPEDRR